MGKRSAHKSKKNRQQAKGVSYSKSLAPRFNQLDYKLLEASAGVRFARPAELYNSFLRFHQRSLEAGRAEAVVKRLRTIERLCYREIASEQWGEISWGVWDDFGLGFACADMLAVVDTLKSDHPEYFAVSSQAGESA